MPRTPLPPGMLALGLLAAACGPAPPWADPAWRPERPPQRIVAGSLLAAEVLLEIAPRERIAGVHVLAADPRYSCVVAQVGDLPRVGAEPEQLLAVRPDLVICDPFTRPETLALLSQAHVPVVVTQNPTDFDGIAANLRHIGRLCHLEQQAERLVAAMAERLQRLRARAPELAAWRVMNLSGALETYGSGSLFAALVVATGARSEARDRGVGPYRKLDIEALLHWQPDALVIGADDGDDGAVPAWIRQHPALPLLRCVERQRLVVAAGAMFSSTSHHLVTAAERLQQTLLQWGQP